jgi:hypothetical protein
LNRDTLPISAFASGSAERGKQGEGRKGGRLSKREARLSLHPYTGGLLGSSGGRLWRRPFFSPSSLFSLFSFPFSFFPSFFPSFPSFLFSPFLLSPFFLKTDFSLRFALDG